MNSGAVSSKGNNRGDPIGPGFPVRAMEEIWEMNIHINPMDDDTRDQIIFNKM
jgi:hypothetical protein